MNQRELLDRFRMKQHEYYNGPTTRVAFLSTALKVIVDYPELAPVVVDSLEVIAGNRDEALGWKPLIERSQSFSLFSDWYFHVRSRDNQMDRSLRAIFKRLPVAEVIRLGVPIEAKSLK